MANILTFQPRRSVVGAALPKNGPGPKAGPASVIIFPGVRYERLGDKKTARPRAVRVPKRRENG